MTVHAVSRQERATDLEIKRFVHVNVVCSDFDKSFEFYTEVLGATAHAYLGDDGVDVRPAMGMGDDGAPGFKAVLLYWGDARGGPYIDLLEWTYPPGTEKKPERRSPLGAQDRGLVRVALQVDSVDEWVARLKEYGTRVTTPQDVILGPWRQKLVLFEDPDGTLLELVEFPEGQKRKYPEPSFR
jgi:catechol 2,3-dioxygenase-like lactoylglutathione lyase family enzyme